MDDLYCVIMAGGAGTRFWPASTEASPKQLLTLVGSRSLLQMAVDRARSVAADDHILIVTNALLADAVRRQVPELPAANTIAEPCRRDTAAAVALAALVVHARGGKRVAILTADHLISPVEAFATAVRNALDATRQQPTAIVTFGIVPTYAATGFGYVELGEGSTDAAARPVLRFVEKPDAATAAAYLSSGRFLWNSGMFVFGVDAMLGALRTWLPRHLDTLAPVVIADDLTSAAFAAAFAQLPKISIDKGVMEKHSTVLCVPATFAWSDVGSFPALAEHLDQDDKGNAHRATLHTLDATNNVVWCEDGSEEVAIVGVEGLVIVRAGKRTLVMPKNRAEDVKKLVEAMSLKS